MTGTDDSFCIINDDVDVDVEISDETLLKPSTKEDTFYDLSNDVNHSEWNTWDESRVSTDIHAQVTISDNIPQPYTTIYDFNIVSSTMFNKNSNSNSNSKLNTLKIKDTTRRVYIFNKKICPK